MRTRREFIVLLGGAAAVRRSSAQDRPARILYFTHSAGYRHDVIPTSRDVLQRIGATADFQITMSEDVAVFTTENLLRYGGIMFFTTGELPMSNAQRVALTDFIQAGGGFLGVHSATDTFYQWPEYRKIIGGYFDQHPWGTFNAPIVVEDPSFPGMKQWPQSFTLNDEIYQMKMFSRENTRVLMRLDASKLDLTNKMVHRDDRDFAVAWAKMYGKGRVFYTTLGHVEANWDKPEMQTMFVEALKWVFRLVDADVTPRPAPKK